MTAETVPLVGVPGPPPLSFHTCLRLGDGSVALSDVFNHRILVFDGTGACVRSFGERGSGPAQFWYVQGMAVAEDRGTPVLAVCDTWNHRIQIFDPTGGHLRSFGGVGDADDRFDEPTALLPAASGGIWVLDRCNHRIKRVSLTGETLQVIDETSLEGRCGYLASFPERSRRIGGGLSWPSAFDILPDGSLLVADTNNRRLVVVSTDGRLADVVDLPSPKGAPPFFPQSLVVAGESVVVSDPTGATRRIPLDRPWLSADEPGATSRAAARMWADGLLTVADADGMTLTVAPAAAVDYPDLPPPSAFAEADAAVDGQGWNERYLHAHGRRIEAALDRGASGDEVAPFVESAAREIVACSRTVGAAEEEALAALLNCHAAMGGVRSLPAGGNLREARELIGEWQLAYGTAVDRRKASLDRLAANVDWAVRLVGKGGAAPGVSETKSELVSFLRRGWEERRKEFDDAVDWLKGGAARGNEGEMRQRLLTLAGLGFSGEHLLLLEEAMGACGEPVDRTPVSGALLSFMDDARQGMDTRIYLLLAGFYAENGRWDGVEGVVDWAGETTLLDVVHCCRTLYETALERGEASAAAAMTLRGIREQAKRSAAPPPLQDDEYNLWRTFRLQLADLGMVDEAVELARRIRERYPDRIAAAVDHADSLRNAGRFDEALRAFDELMERVTASEEIDREKAERAVISGVGALFLFVGSDAARARLEKGASYLANGVADKVGGLVGSAGRVGPETAADLRTAVARHGDQPLFRLYLATALALAGDDGWREELAGEDRLFPKPENRLCDMMCERMAGAPDRALAVAEGDDWPTAVRLKAAVEKLVAAVACGDESSRDRSIGKIGEDLRSVRYLWHYVMAPEGGGAAVERAFAALAEALRKEGGELRSSVRAAPGEAELHFYALIRPPGNVGAGVEG